MRKPAVVILAAGRGTRLKSDLPKALQPLCGRPMVGWLLEAAAALKPAKAVVVAGYRFRDVKTYAAGRAEVVEQKPLLGSGHAVGFAKKVLKGHSGEVVVLYCDTPRLTARTLEALLARHRAANASATLLTVEAANPFGYGRVKRASDGSVRAIVEENDATPEEKKIREVNVGAYVFESAALFAALERVKKNPAKKEYYLNDAVGILASEGRVEAVIAPDAFETNGVNTLAELADAENALRGRILEGWMAKGVRVRDPKSVYVDADVKIGEGTVLEPNVVIQEGSTIGKNCVIGPFARIRGGSRIADDAVIGNFVEVVRSTVGAGTQVKHLAYLGDAVIGKKANVGCGTITANYDGKKKHRTSIGDGARIGSGTVLVAPVTVGRGAVTGAGSVVTKGKNVRPGETVVGVPARPVLKSKKRKR